MTAGAGIDIIQSFVLFRTDDTGHSDAVPADAAAAAAASPVDAHRRNELLTTPCLPCLPAFAISFELLLELGQQMKALMYSGTQKYAHAR